MSQNIDRKLYSENELARVIKKYEEFFSYLRRKLGEEFVNKALGVKNNDSIVDIKRWLVEGENRMFWDYLCATHGIMEDEMKNGNLQGKFNINDGIWCTKLIFASGKEVVFTREREALLYENIKWVISLDKFFYALQKIWWIEEFTRISNELYRIEVKHFTSETYIKQKEKIMKSTIGEIMDIFNITDVN